MRQRIVVMALIGAIAATLSVVRPGAAPKAEKPGWTNLFDGVSLNGWKASEHPDSWAVKDGTLACSGDRSHLFYTGAVQDARFENFEAEVEVKTGTGANSGVFILTAWQDTGWPAQGFEIQVNNTQPIFAGDSGDPYRENKKTGSLYGIRNTYKALAPDNQWFTITIRVEAPRIVVHVNDALVVDYVEPEGEIATLSTPLQKIGAGTFALQCHDAKSPVQYRRIAVHPLPPTPAAQVKRAPNPDTAFAKRYRLARDNFPLVDLRTLDASDTARLEPALAAARAGGLFVGVTAGSAAVRDEAGIDALMTRFAGTPVFVGLRAEAAGWAAHLPARALAKIDYVIAGGRAVDQTVGILDTEPIDVVTLAPQVFGAASSDAVRQQLIEAAVRNGVAIEINGRQRVPDEAFVRKAKAAGAKFTLGECAVDTPAGAYCFDLVEKVGLGWKDMFEPGQQPTRGAR